MIYLFLPVFCFFATLIASTEILFPTTDEEPKKYNLCICAIFRDEAPYLKEWIEYHRLVGVEHFFLYNNESRDNYLKVLQPYLEHNIVELVDYPKVKEKFNLVTVQKRVYNYCITYLGDQTKWLAIIDIDEFIVPVDKPDLTSYLAQFDEDPTIGGIQINWQLYGTSWLPAIPKNKLLIESLLLKAPWDYISHWNRDNKYVKSIVKPHAVDVFHVHHAYYKSGFMAYPGKWSSKAPIQIDQIRINHYWTRAEDFFYKVRMGSRKHLPFLKIAEEEDVLEILGDLNQVEDPIMMRFVPELRKRMLSKSL